MVKLAIIENRYYTVPSILIKADLINTRPKPSNLISLVYHQSLIKNECSFYFQTSLLYSMLHMWCHCCEPLVPCGCIKNHQLNKLPSIVIVISFFHVVLLDTPTSMSTWWTTAAYKRTHPSLARKIFSISSHVWIHLTNNCWCCTSHWS